MTLLPADRPDFIEIAIAENVARRSRRAAAVAAGDMPAAKAAEDARAWDAIVTWSRQLYQIGGKWRTDIAVPLPECARKAHAAATLAAKRTESARAAGGEAAAAARHDRTPGDLAALADALDALATEIATHPEGAHRPVGCTVPIAIDPSVPRDPIFAAPVPSHRRAA